METRAMPDALDFGQESVYCPSIDRSSSSSTTKETMEIIADAEGVVFTERKRVSLPTESGDLLDALEKEFFTTQSRRTIPMVDDLSIPSTTTEEHVDTTPGLYNSQFNLDGMPTAHPFPTGCLPAREPLQSMISEFAYPRAISADAMALQILNTPLGQLPTSYQALAADHVPKELAQHGIAFLVYGTTRVKNATASMDARSQSAVSFYKRFGVHVTNDADDGGGLVNWRTVFYVVDYMRRFPTAACYQIEDQPFVEFAGTDEAYDFENWHAREDHATRLFAIAMCAGDSESAVCQLDRLLRFKRSQGRSSHCVTVENQALVFVDYTIDDGDDGSKRRPHTAWINVALNDDVVHDLLRMRHLNEEYYDGPYCETCRVHHIQKLSYCGKCLVTQYCSLKCKKQDARKHKKLCQHNRK